MVSDRWVMYVKLTYKHVYTATYVRSCKFKFSISIWCLLHCYSLAVVISCSCIPGSWNELWWKELISKKRHHNAGICCFLYSWIPGSAGAAVEGVTRNNIATLFEQNDVARHQHSYLDWACEKWAYLHKLHIFRK